MELKAIAHIYNDFTEKFGIPRQSGLVPQMISQIVFEKEYREQEALRGIEEYSHLWLLWHFSENSKTEWSPCVRPPRLGGNKRVGVFATRSPFRPNNIAISSVKLEKIEFDKNLGPVLHISGADIMDGTPVLDIKPYIPYTDSHPDAKGGFSLSPDEKQLTVTIPPELERLIPEDKLAGLISALKEDPRPGYIDDDRRFGFQYAGFEIGFSVREDILTVISIEKISE